MTNSSASPSALADQLLTAQVAWIIDELSGDRLLALLERDVDELLARAADVRLDAIVTPDRIMAAVDVIIARVPSSTTVETMAEAVADHVHAGPTAPVRAAELVTKAQVGAVIDAVLAMRPLVAQLLDQMAMSPGVGTLAQRFVTQLVMEALEANKALTKKIPGVRSVVSLGTSAATKMVGAVDKQAQSLFGDTPGKGAAAATRRLNNVLLSTMADPLLRGALLEVYDAQSEELIDGLNDVVSRSDVRTLVAAIVDIAGTAAMTPPVRALIAAMVDAFYLVYGDRPVCELMDEAGLTRDDILVIVRAIAPQAVAAAIADGWLEQAVRDRLAPFFASPAVAAILA